MKIVFLGTPDFAVPSLEALIKTSWIEVLGVCTQTDKEAGRGKKVQEPPVKRIANENGILLFQCQKISKESDIINQIKNLKPDILITCAFGQILSQEVLDIAPHGVINVHASLLPKYRGAAPINWAIINGEKETGISIMKTELGIDSGPILLQEKCAIKENETAVELFQKLSFLGADILIKALELIRAGKANFIPQDNAKATKAPMLKKELGLIDWNDSVKNIHNKIRGLQPWPSAYTHFNRQTIKLWDCRIVACNDTTTTNLSPGTIVSISDCITVQTREGLLNIHKLQVENKNIINSKDWINGSRAKVGDRFEIST